MVNGGRLAPNRFTSRGKGKPLEPRMRKGYITSQVPSNISIMTILDAILAAILDFRHIEISDAIYFCILGFLDPENLGKDVLQAKFHQILV